MKEMDDSTQHASATQLAGTSTPPAPPARPKLTLGQRSGTAPRAKAPGDRRAGALRVEVVNANLKFVEYPVLVGHYRGGIQEGAEGVLDDLLGGALRKSLQLGRYPQELKAQQVFVNTAQDEIYVLRDVPRPSGVVVVGLGDEGHLRARDLVTTVRLGTIAWAQHLVEDRRLAPTPTFSLATTLLGSGGPGMTPGQAARCVAEGIVEANRLLASVAWPVVDQLNLVELYLDRATDAWRSLQLLQQACPGQYSVARFIRNGTGALLRPLDSSYRGAGYDLISATTRIDERGGASVCYTLDTRRARTEVQAVAAQSKLLRELVAMASSGNEFDGSIGRTLFKLLVPLEMRPYLAGASEMQIELDQGTAGIPWELLDSGRDADIQGNDTYQPWAIRAKLLRKLRTQDFRKQPQEAGQRGPALVIGDPWSNDSRYPVLPGARREAKAVASLLKETLGAERTRLLVGNTDKDRGPDARQVVAHLLDNDWSIVHIAAHGQLPEAEQGGAAATPGWTGQGADAPDRAARAGGIVLSNGSFLGAEEFARMQRVPELVFINCCHLAATGSDSVLTTQSVSSYDRPYFAASVAESLIKTGVRCVIAAGWAVDDADAETFAACFYKALLTGTRFLDAVAQARAAVYREGANTWAAYQCYGDADWKFMERKETAAFARGADGDACAGSAREDLDAFYAGIATPQALMLAVERIQTELRVNGLDGDSAGRHLRHLHKTYAQPDPRWERKGAVAEAFGTAWREAGDLQAAANWYQQAVGAADGKASLYAAEQLENIRVRLAMQQARLSCARPADSVDAKAARTRAIDMSRNAVKDAASSLARLIAMYPTMERVALCASATKRLAMLERLAGDRQAELTAIHQTAELYREAESRAWAQQVDNVHYAACNRRAAELVEHMATQVPGDYETKWDELADTARIQHEKEPDFWSCAVKTELWISQSVARRCLADHLKRILDDLTALHGRIGGVNNWMIVRDQCDFVLSEYLRHASASECQAAQRLLRQLEVWTTAGSENPLSLARERGDTTYLPKQ